jgi:hypothetical protein
VLVAKRLGSETYPQPKQAAAQFSVVYVSDPTAYHQTQGSPSLLVVSGTINLQPGSRVKVEGMVTFVGSVAAGRAILSSPQDPGVIGNASFDVAQGSNYRTLNFIGFTDVQPAGPYTIGLFLDVNGSAGARIDSAGPSVLVLTEIPAS